MQLWDENKTRLYDALFARVVRDQQQMSHRDVIKNGLPEFCESALKHRARQIFSDHNVLKMHASARFDLDRPSIRKAFQELVDEVIDSTVFSNHEVGEVINSAIDLQYDIIVRPREKLLELLFHNADICSKQDTVVVLSGFGYTRRFVLSLTAEIDYWPTDRLKKDDLEELATEVEKNTYKQAPISELMREIDLLLDFESRVFAHQSTRIRSDVFYGMLEERNLHHFRSGLQSEHDTDFWKPAEIVSALERFLLIGNLSGELYSGTESVQSGDKESSIRAKLLEIQDQHRDSSEKSHPPVTANRKMPAIVNPPLSDNQAQLPN